MIYYKETDSTNLRAIEAAKAGAPHGEIFVADLQRAGRGRRGRTWESPAGANVYMTMLLRPEFAPEKAPMLTLIMAMSVAEAIQKVTGISTGIKWPNDLVLSGRKVCGILTEMSVQAGTIEHVVIGVGINVNEQEFPPELQETATFLSSETKEMIERTTLISAIEEEFWKYYHKFEETNDLIAFLPIYNERLVNYGREVRVLEPGNEYEAVAEGINKHGELLVRMPDGEMRSVFAGEVSVRGIYGYV